MSDQIEITDQTENRQIPSREATAVNTTDSAQEQKKRSLKGMLIDGVMLCGAAPASGRSRCFRDIVGSAGKQSGDRRGTIGVSCGHVCHDANDA
jgi:hypothetical protein